MITITEGMKIMLLKEKKMVPPDNTTKSVGVSVEATATKSTTTTGVGSKKRGDGTIKTDQTTNPRIFNL